MRRTRRTRPRPVRRASASACTSRASNLAAAGKWSEAVERFRRVVEIRASPKALYTLGEAQEHAGQLVAARASYQASLAAARAGGARDVAAIAQEALGRLAVRVPHISVRLDDRAARSHGSDARVTIDSRSVPLGTPVDVDPGAHEVRVEASDTPPFTRNVQLAEGQSEEVVVGALEPTPQPPAPPPVARAEVPPPHTSPLVPILVGAAGLAAGVAGLVVRLDGQSGYDSASGKCTGIVCPSDSVAASGNAGRGRIISGTVVMAVGAAVAAGGGLWWALSIRGSGSVRASVGVDAGGARAVLGGTF